MKQRMAALALGVAILGASMAMGPGRAEAAAITFTVNSTGDGVDASPGNGTCATATATCTLRAAIEEVNAGSAANTYTITTSVAGTVQLGSTILPGIVRPVTIDGSTAPGYAAATGPTFGVRCASRAQNADGLGLSATSTVRAVRITNCDLGIDIGNGAAGSKIVGNHIGTDGVSFAEANAVTWGIRTLAPNTVIGGSTAADRNVIAGFIARGINVADLAINTRIQGNYIGTNATGTAAVMNPSGNKELVGSEVGATGASMAIDSFGAGTQILGNVVSGNPGWGLAVAGSNTIVKGNLVGLDATGTNGIGNFGAGIIVTQGTGMVIGGTGAGEGNVVADVRAQAGVPSLAGRALVDISGGSATVLGNKIGTNAAGTATVGTPGTVATPTFGVVARGRDIAPTSPANVTIGGSAPGAGNLISGSTINVSASSYNLQSTVNAVTVKGNRIGTNAAGTASLSNQTQIGTRIGPNVAATIGGPGAGEGNVVSGNTHPFSQGFGAIQVNDNQAGVTIQGNRIGTNATGTAALPNQSYGIRVAPQSQTSGTPFPTGSGGPVVIGGAAAGAGNLISGNVRSGLSINGASTIKGNRIGTNAAGTSAIPNSTDPNLVSGAVELTGAGITFGGSAAGEGNLVSGNARYGVSITGTNVPVVQGNKIGTTASGTGDLGNGREGVSISGKATGAIGGTGAGQGNTIAYNAGPGVLLLNTKAVDVRGNAIHSNDSLAIDLLQHLKPDVLSAPSNGDQIHPTLTSVTAGGGATNVAGTVRSDKAGPIQVDVYASNACPSATGAGEAKQYLGTISVPYAGGGVAIAFSSSVAASSVGSVVTATSTVPGNGTSQFSTCTPVSDLAFTVVDSHTSAPVGTEVASRYTVTNQGPAAATGISVSIEDLKGSTKANDAAIADLPTQGSVDAGLTTWNVGTLAPGASASVCLRGTIVRSTWTFVVDEDQTIEIPALWAPRLTTQDEPGIKDPYRGNSFGDGSIEVGPAAGATGVCPLPTITIDDASLTRPASGTSPMTFTVRLSSAQSRPVKVKYATANAKAVAVEDYVATSGELTIPAGQTTGTIAVPIVGNQSDEPDKAFTLQLSAPTAATIADATATGTVKANHLLQGCPPGSTANQRFVCHLYFDALGRAPEPGGFTYWVGKLNAGTPRSTMAKSYLTQNESLRKVADRAYVLYLGRHGTSAELANWAAKLKAKTVSTQDIRIAVLSSAEYSTKTGGTNTRYVQQMYRDVFRRDVDSSGLAYWVGQLNAGKTRANVATRFMAEAEGKRKIVGDIYLRFLRREPTTAEATGWVNKIAAGKTEVDVGIGLVASTEYYTRPSS
jgi:titin